MSIKSIALAAATVAATASFATADSYFENGRTLDSGDVLELGLVTADSNGVVEIYDYHRGEAGALLGSKDIFAGANTNTRIRTGLPVTTDVIALLKIDGEVVDSQVYDIDN